MNRLILISLLFSALCSFSQEKRVGEYYFGINFLQSAAGGNMLHYAIIHVVDDKMTITNQTRKNFFLQMTGKQNSKANPENINFFRKHNIDFRIVNNLWMLFYSEYPNKSKTYDEGWAQLKYSPSPAQMEILKQYGMENKASWIYGDNLIRLLKDMMDIEWVNNYKSAQ